MSTRETTGAAPASESSKRLADVAIIIPHYNHAEFIGEAVASALAQEAGRPRVVVVDDGSTDPDVEAALDALPDEVTVIRQENAGVSVARNRGADETTEPYLIFLDSDDRMPPDAAGRLLDALEADPDSAYAYGKMRYFGAWSGEVDFPDFDPYKMLYRSIVGWLGLIRRTALEDVGGFDPSVLGFEDWNLMLAFLEHGYGAARVEEVVLEYRKHHETSSLEAHRSNYHGFYRQLRRRHPDLYARADELAAGSDLTARGRMIYRTWWAWRPLPGAVEQALYRVAFRAAARSRASSTSSA